MDQKQIIFEQVRSGGCLSYILGCQIEKACVVLDPEVSKIEDYLAVVNELDAQLLYVIDTHTHADHNSAAKILREKTGAKVVMHHDSEAFYVDLRVSEGDSLTCGRLTLEVLHTPGHTKDSACFLFDDRLFTGDTLLVGGCGRTDLPGGDAEKQYESLQRLASLGDQIRVYPAHDYRPAYSTLAEEKQTNPRLRIGSKEEFVHFMTSRKPPLPRKFRSAIEWNRSPIQGTQRGLGEGI